MMLKNTVQSHLKAQKVKQKCSPLEISKQPIQEKLAL